MYRLYCSPDTVAINLSHPFLIKWLREGEGRGIVPLYLSPQKAEDMRPKSLPRNKKLGGKIKAGCGNLASVLLPLRHVRAGRSET
jgi:hypothetical protein